MINRNASRLALGTVQFGLPYGVANHTGQVSVKEAESVLAFAERSGIRAIDTAIAYGESEKILGDIGVQNWDVTSKLPALPADCSDVEAWVGESLDGSLRRLKKQNLGALLIHRPDQLLLPVGEALYSGLRRMKESGRVRKIGVSVPDLRLLPEILARFEFDIVQAAMNIVDRRFMQQGWLDVLPKKGIEIQIRSIFLQGLLLMRREDRPAKFRAWDDLWQLWSSWLASSHVTPLAASLSFVSQFPQINKMVVGVDSVRHLQEIIDALDTGGLEVPRDFQSDDPNLIDPWRWEHL